MKKIIFSAILLISASVHAQRPPFTRDQQDHCIYVGQAFQNAALYRNSRLPPETVLQLLSGRGLPKEQLKEIINLVYFDPGFVNAGGQALFNQIYENCLYPKGQFQPLK